MDRHYFSLPMLIKKHIAIGLLLCCTTSQAQQASVADTVGTAYSQSLARIYALRNELFLEKLKAETADRKLLKYYQANFKELFKSVNDKIIEREIISVPEISSTLERILAQIKEKNPELPEDIQILILRDVHPNAYALGDHTLFVTMGLLAFLENEDQVAGVLSHEIAHLMMKHTLRAMQYTYESTNENNEAAKAIRSIEVKKADRAFELLKTSIYTGGKLRRAHEMEADSAGYLLFRNTGYQQSAFVDALEIIFDQDSVKPDGVVKETYRRFFDLPDQKFRDQWLKVDDFSSYNYGSFTKKLNEDSVSTHPSGEDRLQYLNTHFSELSQHQPAAGTGDSISFHKIRVLAQKQFLPNLFFNEQYGHMIYLLLLRLQEKPEDVVAKEWLGTAFQKIYEARRDYQLNRYLARVSPADQTSSYIQFLSFMWNLKPDELKNIAAYYSPAQQQ